MYCRSCGEHMNDNQAICLKCGVKTGEGDAFCPNCGEAIKNPDAEVCLGCGVSLKKRRNVSLEGDLGGHDKVTIALICFFFGGLGIHNFMMGEKKKGIFKIAALICFGIGCIFALIDFIKILCGTYVVDPNKLI